MKLGTKIGTLSSVALVAGAVLVPTQAGAQTTQVCGGEPVTIMGTSGDDVLEGTNGPDVIFAAQGDDVITGLGGDDLICAGQGDDIVLGGAGFDIIFGAQGNDVLFAANGSSAADRADTRGARIFGGAGDDLIVGSNRWDRMQGGLGVDQIDGYEGRDWIRGGGDTDYIDGGAGIDDAHGGNGHDHLRGTTGDTLRGSNGNDLCNLRGAPELIVSCTESAQAFANARHMPVVPPTESGVIQIADYQTELINGRETLRYEDVWASNCDVPASVHEEWNAQNDFFLGPNWSIDIEVSFFEAFGPKLADTDLDLDYFSGSGLLLTEFTQIEVYLYEDGAWRATQCG